MQESLNGEQTAERPRPADPTRLVASPRGGPPRCRHRTDGLGRGGEQDGDQRDEEQPAGRGHLAGEWEMGEQRPGHRRHSERGSGKRPAGDRADEHPAVQRVGWAQRVGRVRRA
ncbi:hypothetical protein [Candidatus Frankia alpina]|uniref:hypothetical protein n=1 Tax=Candidatus Frankia alpina TaxID=2699483 RepID=UPI001F23AA25|nr:hypothetical protein [Candidatus Frankia alpina]